MSSGAGPTLGTTTSRYSARKSGASLSGRSRSLVDCGLASSQARLGAGVRRDGPLGRAKASFKVKSQST